MLALMFIVGVQVRGMDNDNNYQALTTRDNSISQTPNIGSSKQSNRQIASIYISCNEFLNMPYNDTYYKYDDKILPNTENIHKEIQGLQCFHKFDTSLEDGKRTCTETWFVQLNGFCNAVKPFLEEEYQNNQPFYKRHYWKAMASIGSSALILGIYLGIKLTMHYTRPVAA